MGGIEFEVFRELRRALEQRSPAVLVTVIEAPDPSLLGKKALAVLAGSAAAVRAATLPPEWLEPAREVAERRLAGALAGRSGGRAEERTHGRRVAVETLPSVPGVALSVEAFFPRPRLIVAGGGHIAVPTHEIADIVGFAVTVLDDRPEFANEARFPRAERVVCDDFTSGIKGLEIDEETSVVVVTRGHLHDLEVLRAIAGTTPAYVGMIGSRRRTITVLERLAAEGFPESFIERIHSPIGLDIGAETPQEIGLAIVAEVVCALRGGTGAPLRYALRRAGKAFVPGRGV